MFLWVQATLVNIRKAFEKYPHLRIVSFRFGLRIECDTVRFVNRQFRIFAHPYSKLTHDKLFLSTLGTLASVNCTWLLYPYLFRRNTVLKSIKVKWRTMSVSDSTNEPKRKKKGNASKGRNWTAVILFVLLSSNTAIKCKAHISFYVSFVFGVIQSVNLSKDYKPWIIHKVASIGRFFFNKENLILIVSTTQDKDRKRGRNVLMLFCSCPVLRCSKLKIIYG